MESRRFRDFRAFFLEMFQNPLVHTRDWKAYVADRVFAEREHPLDRHALRARMAETYDIVEDEKGERDTGADTPFLRPLCRQLLQWTDTRAMSVVYDSDRDEETVCGIATRLLGRQRVAIVVVTREGDVFGIYVPRFALRETRLCVIKAPTDTSFLFAFNTRGRCMTPVRWGQLQSTLTVEASSGCQFVSFVVADEEKEVKMQRKRIAVEERNRKRRRIEENPGKFNTDAIPKAVLSIGLWGTMWYKTYCRAGIFSSRLDLGYGVDGKTLVGTDALVNYARIVALQLS